MFPLNASSFIYSGVRTPLGRFKGALSSLPAPELASFAIRDAVARTHLVPEFIDELILGNVLSAGLGQAPARQAACKAGLPSHIRCMTVNKVCGSGLMAVILADQKIRLGESRFIVAGGMESMSCAPFLVDRKSKEKNGTGGTPVDSMVWDGLWDSFNDCHMGHIAESLARKERYSRKEQDWYAVESYSRARVAQDRGWFDDEIVPVRVMQEGKPVWIRKDEQPYAHDLSRITELPPAFVPDTGSITAGNASSLSDGAAALVVGPYRPELRPLVRIAAHASCSIDPHEFPLAPVHAIQQLLETWGVASLDEIDWFEINEAFAVGSLAVCEQLGLNRNRVNIHGGAIALGHPIGASGARILVTLIHTLMGRGGRRGVAAICIGGGEALALGIERL